MGRKKTIEKEPVTIRFKELANGNKSVYLDIYKDGKRTYEFLKLYIVPEVGRGKAEARRKNAETMATANVIKAQRVLDIKNSISGIISVKSKMKLMDWIDNFKAYKMKTSQSPSRIAAQIECTRKQLIAYKGDNIKLSSIDKKYCVGFIEFLNNTKKSNGEPLSSYTKIMYCNHLNEMLSRAVKGGMIYKNPFSEVDKREKPKKPETSRVFLDIEEVKKLAETECKVPVIKQAFMFSCFCGLRISDIRRLKWSDIREVTNEDGTKSWHLSIIQKKTNKMVSYNLSGKAIEWLPEQNGNEFIFNGMGCEQTVLTHIKVWAANAGIKKDITFHTARHTFGTMMLTLGADIYTTSKLMGHTRIATTEIYAKIIDKKKNDAMGLIDKFFDKD